MSATEKNHSNTTKEKSKLKTTSKNVHVYRQKKAYHDQEGQERKGPGKLITIVRKRTIMCSLPEGEDIKKKVHSGSRA